MVNPLSTIYSLNGCTPDPNGIGGKTGDSNLAARAVQSSQIGYNDIIQAVDGDRAGQSGQMAYGVEITTIIDTQPLMNMVKQLIFPVMDYTFILIL
jgi:hypothetical protein